MSNQIVYRELLKNFFCRGYLLVQIQRRRSDVFVDNFERILHNFIVFLLLDLNKKMSVGLNPFSRNQKLST